MSPRVLARIRQAARDGGSTLPLIIGFVIIAFTMTAGAITLGQVFVQQRDLQDLCDGAAAAAAASAADLERGESVASGSSLTFVDVDARVTAYLARDPSRQGVQVRAVLTPDRRRLTLTCRQERTLALGGFFDRKHVVHTVTSSARAAVVA